MPKVIKCPTCQTPIEMPAQLTGQVIKCPGCGKGLKLVPKKSAQPPQGQNPSMGGSMAGTVAGGTISAMSFQGEQAPDDLPLLDSNCAVCGRPTEPEKLTEDNGKLVCRDCIKGARSRIERAEVAPDLIGFRTAPKVVVKRKLIKVGPAVVGVCVAGVALIGAQIYLHLNPRPVLAGRTISSTAPAVKLKPGEKPAPAPDPGEVAPQAGTTVPANAEATTPAVASATPPVEPPAPAPQPANPAPTQAPAPEVGSTLFPSTDSTDPAPASTPPNAPPPNALPAPAPVAPPPITVATLSNDPIERGLASLLARDYPAAYRFFDDARKTKYKITGTDKLTAEQQMAVVGQAAASLGRNDPGAALMQLQMVLGPPPQVAGPPARGEATRSAVLNYALASLGRKPTPVRDLGYAIQKVSALLHQSKDDERAADIFGALLDRAASLPNAPKDQLQPYVQQLDGYVDGLATGEHAGELKWGVDWKPRELVMTYRAARGRTAAVAPPEELQKELEAAKAKALTLGQAVKQAEATQGDVVTAKSQYREALATLADIQMRVEQASAPAPKPRWVEKFDPIPPEGSTTQ